MMGSQERQRRKTKSIKEQKMKSLEFFKPTLATTLAIVLAWLLSVRPAQAGYTVTLQQVGPDVVATGSGAIDLTGLTFRSVLVFRITHFTADRQLDRRVWGDYYFRLRQYLAGATVGICQPRE